MIIVRLSGGIGNQMFQYAAGRRLARVNGTALKLDLSWFGNIPRGDTPRRYELGVFHTVGKMAFPFEVKELGGWDLRRWPRPAQALARRLGLVKKSRIEEKGFSFDPTVLDLTGDLYLDGYWQSEKYFADMASTIRSDFSFNVPPDPVNQALAETVERCNAVSVHLRRGDYVSHPVVSGVHGAVGPEYYRAALEEIRRRVENPSFFVFSDDPEWGKREFRIDAPVTFVDHNGPDKAYEDLRLMTLCRHHVTANSSFSWWGAWLSEYPEKVVIAPKRWFQRDDMDTRDLIPERWLTL